ncbi:hypothetical protein PGTUg99_001706 [Puccinia graminis f. sp. tritici]|uniref:Uncharacterized protein n=1 Tax=Puccinia graminis f. sp. tritici TaxID=56615 RepID=A0A5B0RBB5_PUCGR|nr:hypothetical protein PGTUg99_001706 [Puccinia graminis f. sp. tritici]
MDPLGLENLYSLKADKTQPSSMKRIQTNTEDIDQMPIILTNIRQNSTSRVFNSLILLQGVQTQNLPGDGTPRQFNRR